MNMDRTFYNTLLFHFPAGVDDVLHKTQEDLNRIKTESFFKKTAPPPQPEESAEPEVQEEQPQKEEEKEKTPEEEDDGLFDTSYLDISSVLQAEVHGVAGFKLPDEIDDIIKNAEDDSLFETSNVNEVLGIRKVCGGKFESKKRRKGPRINLDQAVGVLKTEVAKPVPKRQLLGYEDPSEVDLLAVDSEGSHITLVAPQKEERSLLDDILLAPVKDVSEDQIIVENVVREILLSVVSAVHKEKLAVQEVDPLLAVVVGKEPSVNVVKELEDLFKPPEEELDEDFVQFALESAKKPLPKKEEDLDEAEFFAQIAGGRIEDPPVLEDPLDEEDPFNTSIAVDIIKVISAASETNQNSESKLETADFEEIEEDPFDTGCVAGVVPNIEDPQTVVPDIDIEEDPFDTGVASELVGSHIQSKDAEKPSEDQAIPSLEPVEDLPEEDPFDTSVVKDLDIPSHEPQGHDPFETFNEAFEKAVGLVPESLDVHVLTPEPNEELQQPIAPPKAEEAKSELDILSILDPLQEDPQLTRKLCRPPPPSEAVLRVFQEAQKKKDPLQSSLYPDPFDTDVVIKDLGLPDHSSQPIDLLGEGLEYSDHCPAPVLAASLAPAFELEESDPFDTTPLNF